MFLCSLFLIFFFPFFKRAKCARHAKVQFLLSLTQIADISIVIKVYLKKRVLPLFEVFKKIY